MKRQSRQTNQIKKWTGDFGTAYTERNPFKVEDTDRLYDKLYGTTRSQINEEFVGDLDRHMRILEVGSNVGAQLLMLQKMGFNELYGIEIQKSAIEFSKTLSKDINIINGSAFDIPFKSGFFDLVYTSGVLIHISPGDIKDVMGEIPRCTRKYIWGFEYFEDNFTEIEYRGERNLLWKADYAKIYLDTFSDLQLIKSKKIKYVDNQNINHMFLISKLN